MKEKQAVTKRERKEKNKIDMLNGSLLDKILLFALPLAMSSILQQLFNSVDVAVVGRFASSQEQAAVGCNGPVINLLLNLFVGISVGTNVVIAGYIGQGEKEKIRSTVHTSMVVALASGVLLLFLGLLVTKPILLLINTPEDVIDHAVLYLRIYFMGMPFIMIYNFGSAILRSIGDTRRPLYCLVLSGVVNAALNMFLVIVFHMGVAGVGIATVISNMISAGMVWHFLTHEEDPIRLQVRKLAVSGTELKKLLKIGVPAGLQSTVFSFSNVCVQSVLNGFGSAAVAGSAVGLNFEYFTYFVVSAFNQATVTFTSQNFGANQLDRCKKVFRLCITVSMLTAGAMSLTFVFGRSFFISLFTKEPQVAHYAAIRMVIILSMNVIVSTYEIGGAALRGIGYSLTPALITVFGTCVVRLLWVFTICQKIKDFRVLMIVYPITWIITGAGMLITYFTIRRSVFRTHSQERH